MLWGLDHSYLGLYAAFGGLGPEITLIVATDMHASVSTL